MIKLFSYILFNKPYNVLSRFGKDTFDQESIADFVLADKDVYPVGRLDKDSEGLLILTNDTKLNKAILHPEKKLPKRYFAQVDGDITQEAIRQLQNGVMIEADGKPFHTAPCKVIKQHTEPNFPPRNPPIRYRKAIPTSWIQIILTEGKNRQVRKMCAKVGFPVLRLVRTQIGNVSLENLSPGKSRKLTMKEMYGLLQISLPDPDEKKPALKKTKQTPKTTKANPSGKQNQSKTKKTGKRRSK